MGGRSSLVVVFNPTRGRPIPNAAAAPVMLRTSPLLLLPFSIQKAFCCLLYVILLPILWKSMVCNSFSSVITFRWIFPIFVNYLLVGTEKS